MKSKNIQAVFFSICLAMKAMATTLTHESEEWKKLDSINQTHLLTYWPNLVEEQQQALIDQINQLDLNTFASQRETVAQSPNEIRQDLSPFTDYEICGKLVEDKQLGEQLISEGKVGCLIVAGGQGSRLGYEGPKGFFPVSIVKGKSLFQLFAEKTLAASKKFKRPLLLAIMTSTLNHIATEDYFKENDYFGLEPSQVYFFIQHDLPFLNERGELFLETPFKIAAGPDGNAAALKHFVGSSIWQEWKDLGVAYLNYLHVDNPLADPYDAELIGYQSKTSADVAIKCVQRQDPSERVGVIVKNHGKVQVIEYSEISDEERFARDEAGELKHVCANISLFSFSMDFVKKIADLHYHSFPFHKAWKAVSFLNEKGETEISKVPQAWKFEKFIFDLLPYADNVKALLCERKACFAPLKNATGTDSIVDVQKALQRFDREIFESMTHLPISDTEQFELDPQFYYPTDEMKRYWFKKALPSSSYITPEVESR